MLNLNINCDILQEKNIVRFNGAALELMRYEGQEIQVNTYIYLEKDGKKYQFITYNHCDAQKNVSLDKKIICEEIQNYEFPEETRKNQIIFRLREKKRQHLRSLQEDVSRMIMMVHFREIMCQAVNILHGLMVRVMTIIWCFYQLKILQWFSGRSLWINSA